MTNSAGLRDAIRAARARRRLDLVEYCPLFLVLVALWSKLAWFSTELRNAGCGCEIPIFDWLVRYPGIVSTALASAFLLLGIVPVLPRLIGLGVLLIIDLYVTILVIANAVYVEYYGMLPSVSGLELAQQLFDVRSAIFSLIEWRHIAYAFDLPLAAIAAPIYAWRLRFVERLPFGKRARVSSGMVAAGFLMALPPAYLVWQDESNAETSASSQFDVCARIGLCAYHVRDVSMQFSPQPPVDEESKARVRLFFENERRTTPKPSELFGVAKGRNLIIMDLESLQSFPIGLEIHGQPIAPHFAEFSKECLNFVNFHDQTHHGTTFDGLFCTLQSLHPTGIGYVMGRYGENLFRGLPAILAEHGYRTISALAAEMTFWRLDRFLPRLGVQNSYSELDYEIVERYGPWLADQYFFEQTLPFLQSQPEPFAAVLLTATNHFPFELPSKHRKLNLGEWEGTRLGDYLHTVHYFDWAFGRFVDQLRASGLLDRSVFVLYGDHQAFHSNEQVSKLLGYSRYSEYDEWVVRKKLPFFIRLPHAEHAAALTVNGGHLDLAPTVLSLLGVPTDGEVFLGKDLTCGDDALVVFRDGSFADGKHYFINRFGPIENCSCYDAISGMRVDVRSMEASRDRARERLEISDLILRGNMIPEISANYKAPPPENELRTTAILPSKANADHGQPRIRWEIRYRNHFAGEVVLVWGLDKFTRTPSHLPEGTFLTYGNSHMNTPMRRDGDDFVVEFEVEANTQLDYVFTITRTWTGKPIEMWVGPQEGHYGKKLTVADADETMIDARTYVGGSRFDGWTELETKPIQSPGPGNGKMHEAVQVQVRYCNPKAEAVVLVWGLDKFTKVPGDLPTETFLTHNNSHMNTPMRRDGDLFVADCYVPDNCRLDYAFTITRTSTGEPANLWRGANAAGAYFSTQISGGDSVPEKPFAGSNKSR